jgi:hypothetical protein
MKALRALLLSLLAGSAGCSVQVASLTVAASHAPTEEVARTALARGWGEGDSCRFWVLGATFGLPKVDEAIDQAMRPLQGAFMRNVTVYSVHPVYILFGWHCYHVVGEVFG